MEKNLEIEAKYIITKEDFDKLIKFFNLEDSKRIKQVNEYFDTSDSDVLKNNWMIRVRTICGQHELTMKKPQKNGIEELNEIIKEEEYQLIKKTGKISQFLPNRQLQIIGVLTTHRVSIPYLEGELFFDESFYNNCVDYEIEYEVHDTLQRAQTTILELFERLCITNYSKSKSKVKRCC